MALSAEIKEIPALGCAAEVFTCLKGFDWCKSCIFQATEYVDFFPEWAPTAFISFFMQVSCLIPAIALAWAIDFYLFAAVSSALEDGPIIEVDKARINMAIFSWALWYFNDCTL